MKKTKFITLILLPVLAIACSKDPHYQHCVDQNDIVVDDSICKVDAGISTTGSHWYFGPRWFGIGSRVSGGSYIPMSGRSYNFSSPSGGFKSSPSISRGGFGSTGHGFSSGGGE